MDDDTILGSHVLQLGDELTVCKIAHLPAPQGCHAGELEVFYEDGATADMDEPYIFLAESEKDAEDKACDYAEVWNNWNDDTIELVSVEKQVASKG